MASLQSPTAIKSRFSRRWFERRARMLLFGLVGFWILAVFALVYHAMQFKIEPATSHQHAQLLDRHGQQNMYLRNPGKMLSNPTILRELDPNPPPQHQHQPQQQPQTHKEAELESQLRRNASPLIIFACHRADYLNRTLTHVLQYIPTSCIMGCPIVVSQDGYEQDVARVVADFTEQYKHSIPIVHIQHEPAQIDYDHQNQLSRLHVGYKKLAIHYGWALAKVFNGTAMSNSSIQVNQQNQHVQKATFPMPDRVIILEEDLLISPDFFDYMIAMAPLLDQDPTTLLTVSAFNDNGKEDFVPPKRSRNGESSQPLHVHDAAARVLRSDFFPGLGWILTRHLWDTELSAKWPQGYWDDWLRDPHQRRGRHILRPEVR